jgi:hypothetical protein
MCLTRRGTMVLATFLLMAVLAPSAARAYEKLYDPYPWCAEYWGDRGGGGTNCGFLTLEQCRAAVSGVHGTIPKKLMKKPGDLSGLQRHYCICC